MISIGHRLLGPIVFTKNSFQSRMEKVLTFQLHSTSYNRVKGLPMQQCKSGHNHLKEIEKVGDWTLEKVGV